MGTRKGRMIFRKLPFLVSPHCTISTHRPINITEYENPIQDNFHLTGGALCFGDNWEKWQLCLTAANNLITHSLLAKYDNAHRRPISIYPIYSCMYPITTRELPQTYLYKAGITEVHRLCGDKNTKLSFILEEILRKAISTTEVVTGNIDTQFDQLLELLTYKLRIHPEGISDHLVDPTLVVQNLMDAYYTNVRNGVSVLDDVLCEYIPPIPKQLTAHYLTRAFADNGAYNTKEFNQLMKLSNTTIEEFDELDDWFTNKINISDVDTYDISIYPELLDIYQLLINSRFNEIHIVYEYDGATLIPTKETMLHTFIPHQHEPEDVHDFITDIEGILLFGRILDDTCNDLTSLELNEIDIQDVSESTGKIRKLELIVHNDAACIIVYSQYVSCTIYIDFTAMAVLSNTLLQR